MEVTILDVITGLMFLAGSFAILYVVLKTTQNRDFASKENKNG